MLQAGRRLAQVLHGSCGAPRPGRRARVLGQSQRDGECYILQKPASEKLQTHTKWVGEYRLPDTSEKMDAQITAFHTGQVQIKDPEMDMPR